MRWVKLCIVVPQGCVHLRWQWVPPDAPLLQLQTSAGKPAKKLCSSEYRDAVKAVKDKSEACKKAHPKIYGKSAPKYSQDNATWHKYAKLEEIGINQSDLMPLPPNSPDMHKVIEHAVNNTCTTFFNYLLDHPEVRSLQQVKDAFTKAFYDGNTVDGIRADVDSLWKTYDIVHRKQAAGGTEGDWPSAKYR